MAADLRDDASFPPAAVAISIEPAAPADADPDSEDGDCPGALRRSFVQEWKVLAALVQSMSSSAADVPMDEIKRAQRILEKYQEQGQLLEPHLESMVCPLMEILQKEAAENPRMDVVKKVCSIIHTLVTVCGYKTVFKFFPNQASHLELAVSLLQVCHDEIEQTSILREESTGQWETKCCLLLWLSMLVLIPFDIASVDTALADSGSMIQNDEIPLVKKILALCKDYLASPGPMREMAGVLLSRLLTRPDMQAALQSFMIWSQGEISSAMGSTAAVFLAPGIMGAIAAIFKIGSRDILYPVISIALDEANQLSKSSITTQSLLLRKFLVKLIQRIGLVYLPPRSTAWRYKGADSLIMHNLSVDQYGHQQPMSLKPPAISPKDVKFGIYKMDQDMEEEDFDVPEQVEEIIEHLLTSLKDKDTIVRWSAAKGIGRITGRLTSSLADEVVGSVLELLNPIQGDGAWHGGCLALAELARRGLLIPDRLPEVVPLIVKALHYDVRRGSHSIGAHVRDAAAYVCWAFARAYTPMLMKEHFQMLAPALLTIACYDREVNCRRAASAAFQENVGRQGDYPHGIDLVNATDYFSLASRSTAYCSVALYVASYEEYRVAMVEELLNSKIRHWDRGIRELSAEALAIISKYDPEYFGGYVLDKLLSWVVSADLNLRHGATLASAEMILALKNNGFTFPQEKQNVVAGVVPAIEKARLYRGKGGEIMRAAVSRFIECESLAHIPLQLSSQKKSILDTINENLRHPNSQIQDLAVGALKAFIHGYMLPVKDVNIERVTLKHLQILRTDGNAAAKRGSALALSALPSEFVVPHWKDIMDSLCNAVHVEENPNDRDAETRVNAVRALVAICKTLYEAGLDVWASCKEGFASPEETLKGQVMETLFEALDDYAVDNRGDVGSWVREAAIVGLEECVVLLCKSITVGKTLLTEECRGDCVVFDSKMAARVVGSLVKQAMEKINRVRDIAGKTLQKILYNNLVDIPFIPHQQDLRGLIPEDAAINWGAPDDAFPRLVPLLQFPAYRAHVMSGLVVSVGGLADSLGKVSLNCLLNFLQGNLSGSSDWLGGIITYILKQYAGNDRVITPTFKTIDLLCSKGVFSSSQVMQPDCVLDILASVKMEIKGSKDFVKITSGINVLAHLASMATPVGDEALVQMLGLLGHRYPKVRKVCAEQLYLVILQKGEELVAPGNLSCAEELVSETIWDGPLENIRSERQKLATLLKLNTSALSQEFVDPGVTTPKRAACDENASYAALLRDMS